MHKRTFKELLSRPNQTILGTFLEIPAAEMAEIVGGAGFDCAIVDAEHGMLGTEVSLELVRGCDAVGLATLYRVPCLDHHRIGQALDFGASAVMVPNIQNKLDAEAAVRAAKYHPRGDRGVNPFTRGAGYNSADEDTDYYQRSNRETAVVLQIEGTEGIGNLEAILDVPDIDCIFIGPFDLSQSLGIPGKVTDPRVLDAIRRIVQTASRKNIAVGSFTPTMEQAKNYSQIGIRFVAYATDTLIAQRACRDLCRMFRT
jgi:4-hydroxy-2-oxoheptanedioate aldolase